MLPRSFADEGAVGHSSSALVEMQADREAGPHIHRVLARHLPAQARLGRDSNALPITVALADGRALWRTRPWLPSVGCRAYRRIRGSAALVEIQGRFAVLPQHRYRHWQNWHAGHERGRGCCRPTERPAASRYRRPALGRPRRADRVPGNSGLTETWPSNDVDCAAAPLGI